MKKEQPSRPSPVELWKRIEKARDDDEIERIGELSDEDLDAELRAGGADPEEIRTRGAAFAKALLERREHEQRAAERLEKTEKRIAERAARRGTLSREELVKRIEVTRTDPRLEQKIAVGFRTKDTGAASAEQLEAMLEEIETLLDLATDEGDREDRKPS